MTKPATVKPRYTHDCDQCRFLGRVDKYDLYVCPLCDDWTGIARYGHAPPAYASRGFLKDVVRAMHRQTSGLHDDEAIILALFQSLPSLVLNSWKRANA